MKLSLRKVVAALGAGVLVASLSAVTLPASASHSVITIQVGAQLGNTKAESHRFFGPRTITVHQGDRVTFNFQGFNTATLLPAGVGGEDWIMDNAEGTGPFSFVAADFDDGPNEFKDNIAQVNTPTDPSCGALATPCNYSGSDVLNLGTPFELPEKKTVTVNAGPGSTFWVVSLIHHEMRMRFQVVSDPAAATLQSAINQRRNSQIAQDLEWAKATDAKYKAKPTFHTTPSGEKVWDVWAGVDNRYAAIYDFYPRRINVPRGATIRWHWDALILEDHTVSMPDPGIYFKIQFDESKCDPDGDDGTAPDNPPGSHPQTGEPVCEPGEVLETDVSHGFWGGTGNGIYKGSSDVEHSGIRGAQAEHMSPPAVRAKTWDVEFPNATAVGKPIKYFCFLHPMEGQITVGQT